MGLWGKRDDMIVHESDPYNAEPPPGALADLMLTPVDSFYGRNHGPVPLIDPRAWRLRVGGLAECDLELSLDELRGQFAQRTLTATLQCAGNRRAGLIKVRDIPGEAPWGPGATSTAEWTGVSLAEVLRAARPREEATHVTFDAPDISQVAAPPQPYGGSTDGGRSWRQAGLGEEAGPWAWRQWRTVIDIPAGPAEIIARAWDTSAAAQPESPVHLWNPKGYVNNSWARIQVTAF